jgi:hypothetical protein
MHDEAEIEIEQTMTSARRKRRSEGGDGPESLFLAFLFACCVRSP